MNREYGECLAQGTSGDQVSDAPCGPGVSDGSALQWTATYVKNEHGSYFYQLVSNGAPSRGREPERAARFRTVSSGPPRVSPTGDGAWSTQVGGGRLRHGSSGGSPHRITGALPLGTRRHVLARHGFERPNQVHL